MVSGIMVRGTIVASDIELKVIGWLERRGIQYAFQTSLAGGHFSLGGAVVDFIIERLAWRVQGGYYHTGVTKEGSDIIQKEMLSALGYTVVDIFGDDLADDRIDNTLQLALMGQEVLH